jgi:GMP synthase (glutamine-hydrolysing)
MLQSLGMTKPDDRPVLIVLHQEHSTPGRVGQMLEARGLRLDIRRPALGQKLPETLAHHAGVVIFGGPMSANDTDDFVKYEIDWINVPLTENRPFLGICLGAQMLVKQLGGQVFGHHEGLTEIGWYPIEPTEEGNKIIEWPRMVYHFHREGFDLPNGATRLASGKVYENQAIRFGENAWGIQFHGELTRVMMHRWVVRGAHRFVLPGAQTGDKHLDGRLLHDGPLRNWMSGMLDVVFRPQFVHV